MTPGRGRVALSRTDASSAMGLGHVMRCLAIAEELLARGGESHFALADPPPGIAERLQRHGIRVHPLPADMRRPAQTVRSDHSGRRPPGGRAVKTVCPGNLQATSKKGDNRCLNGSFGKLRRHQALI